MKTRTLKELLLYNYRYWFGYLTIIGFIVYFLGWKINSHPRGLGQPEIITAAGNVHIANILESPLYPLHTVLQWLSTTLLGVNTLSIRLPGVIIGLFVALVLYNLLKRWFGKPTALLSTAIFISADWFLFIARLGTGAIEFSLWLSLALLCLTKLLERKHTWLLPFAASLGLLLFMPFGVVAVTVLIGGLFICRVFRERMTSAGLVVTFISMLVFTAITAAFTWTALHNVEFLKAVLGIQSIPTISEYVRNVANNLGGIVVVLPNSNPLISPSGLFFVRFFELVFILFGVIMFWRTRVNRLNLLIIILSVALALASGLSAGSRGNGLMLIPAAIFITAGIRHLIHRWKRTFPNNPYARVAAYVPLGILFICTVSLHYASYFILWQNQPVARGAFSRDLELLQNELSQPEYSNQTCYVESSDESFNVLLSKSNLQCEVEVSGTNAKIIEARYFIVKENSPLIETADITNAKALTSETTADNVRWLVVKN